MKSQSDKFIVTLKFCLAQNPIQCIFFGNYDSGHKSLFSAQIVWHFETELNETWCDQNISNRIGIGTVNDKTVMMMMKCREKNIINWMARPICTKLYNPEKGSCVKFNVATYHWTVENQSLDMHLKFMRAEIFVEHEITIKIWL